MCRIASARYRYQFEGCPESLLKTFKIPKTGPVESFVDCSTLAMDDT